MADDESKFVGVWTDWMGKLPAPERLVTPGAVRRLDVGGMMGKAMPKTAEDGTKLLHDIGRELKSILADREGAIFWSPAPGLIDIFYPKLTPQAAELSHSVVSASIDRLVRERTAAPAAAAAAAKKAPPAIERRVDWETFQKICRRAQAKPDQVQTIDVSELILGIPDPSAHLSRRAWRTVDEIVDDFLATGGYCTRYPGNLVLFFFPGLSPSLARIKRRAIAADIERAAGGLARPGKAAGLESEAEPAEADHPQATRTESASGENPEEVARLNKAFAAMAAAPGVVGLAASELSVPDSVTLQMVPVWRAGNQALVGHAVTAHSAGSSNEFATLGVALEQLDMPMLAFAQADVLGRVEAQTPYLVIVPVHWRTLERTTVRTKYLELAARLPEEVRRYVVFSLRDVPEDLMGSRIEECVRELRRFCRATMCRVALGRRSFDQFVGVTMHAVGAELAAASAIERQAMAEMDGFLDAMAPLRTKSFIDGLHTKSLVIAALAAGFDYLSGSAIAGSGGGQGARAFSIPDLYEAAGNDQADGHESSANPAP